MDAESEQTKSGNTKYRKLTLLQYVIYLGVTPCALAALALLVFILVKRPVAPDPVNSTTLEDSVHCVDSILL